MRLFIAIQLNERFKDALEDIQDAMWDAGMDGRFTSRENLHITLAFVGEYGDPERVKDVVESVSVKPFSIGISGVGAFGDLWWAGVDSRADADGPRSKTGCANRDSCSPGQAGSSGQACSPGQAGSSELMGLAKRLRRALAEAGVPFDKKAFRPHITLVRRAEGAEGFAEIVREEGFAEIVREEGSAGKVREEGSAISETLMTAERCSMTVDHISLMRSERGKGGMIYTELARSK